MNKPRQNPDSTRDRLLDTAEKLFAEKGFNAVGVREITTAARTNLAAVNYHFGGKKALYLEVFRSRWHKRASIIQHPLEELENDPGLTLEKVVRTLYKMFLEKPPAGDEHRRHGQLIAREISQPSDAFDFIIEAYIRPVVDMVGRLLGRAMGREVDSRRLLLYALSIFAQGTYFNFTRLMVDRLSGRENDPDFIEQLIDHVTDFAIWGLVGKRSCSDDD
jgi:AcrR family transcriptional regulator